MPFRNTACTSAPLEAPPNMPLRFELPQPLTQALAKQHIEYEFVSTDPVCPYENCTINTDLLDVDMVLLIVLQDSLGQMQFLLPANRLIDVRRLSEQNGRNLQAAPATTLQLLAAAQGLPTAQTSLAAIPQTQAAAVQACTSLRERSILYVTTGITDVFLKITGDSLDRYLAHVVYSDFTAPVDDLWTQLREDAGEKRLFDAVSHFTTRRIYQRLDKTLEIPPMSETAKRIVKLRSDPMASVRDLAQIVEVDPSLAAHVVSWASSSYYNAPGGIRSVNDAVVRVLGFDLVMNLALGLSLSNTLDMPTDGPRDIIPYWQQAVFTAALTEALVKRMARKERPSVGLAYLIGLLNNFGFFILGFVFRSFFSLISRFIEANPHHSHAVIEQYVLGISREHICAWVMTQWDMPEAVITALRWQHIPEYNGKHSTYVQLLYVANQLVQRIHKPEPAFELRHRPISPSLLAQLDLTPEALYEALSYVVARKSELMKMADMLER
ncbi:MAG: HDOD domain-containing protein [Gammaproteobacteria bacterium]